MQSQFVNWQKSENPNAVIKDLYKIYSIEAIIIGFFSIAIGVSLYYIFGLLINRVISELFFDFYFSIFTFKTITILTMILSTVIIILFSLVVPLSRLRKIKPIDVINSSE